MEELLRRQKEFFLSHQTKDLQFRRNQLLKLLKAIQENETSINEALRLDLNKSPFEAYTTEVGFCINSIKHTIKNLKKWTKKQMVPTPFTNFHSTSFILKEPLGTILIIGPYNYPFQLVIEPLIGALAAGNTVIIKPSEHAIHTEKVLSKLIHDSFDPKEVVVVTGDASVTNTLIHLKFDHIFFTGSIKVGKIVYEAASQNLVPVTLELGGKSPTIVDETANLRFSARRIAFGKWINAGQTCIAPDYLYIQSSIKDEFIKELKQVIDDMKFNTDNFGKIIHKGHFNRLVNLIDSSKVIHGNEIEPSSHYISPTLMDQVTWDDPIMQEEIFGPILPILTFETIDEVISILKEKEKPLALYLFSENKANQTKVMNTLSFGSGAINDTIMQINNRFLPFGGIGSSGIGSYHGHHSIDTFSHHKSMVKKFTWFDLDLLYPPYSEKTLNLIRKILK